MKRYLLISLMTLMTALTGFAQRTTDYLDRGLVAMKSTSGIFLSWRIQSDEYYDVKYNVYRNGTKIAENLNVSNYTDASGSTSNTYTVAAVVRGKEQSQCAAVTPWASDYFDITPKHDSSLKCTYVPNDACCADVDGDGQVEILLKYDNSEESSQLYPKAGPTVDGTATGEYTLLEVLKLDGTVLWWVNCGPNMGDFQNNEQNIVGYDWDQDGSAEVVMRLAEGSVVHMADGTTYTIGADGKNGTSWTNYREPKVEGGVEWFTHYGNEFLFYCNGSTGSPYQCITFPLKRFETGETDLYTAWGDGYGHRSSKFFFGAPYLDGRHPSIFLGRGIYTRHKFIAYDVDPATHALTTRWTWTNNQKGSPWYGQGYHNYGIVDVDWDGRDEIVWGSMVIDDNGKGLSTTGLGHGDAQHHGDFDPYTHGQEGFFCNEDAPANNYRDLTTSKIYHRVTGSDDDGRAMCGNFSNSYPGAMGFSAHDNPISCVTGSTPTGMSSSTVSMNFRCYWDGDLQEESFNGASTRNSAGVILKYGTGTIKTLTGTLTNNDTKATPSYMGDIFGDWREEFIMRTASNGLRIYSTTTATKWRNYSLWYDKQYRNGMVWEPCGYNQPPHVSYFLGELEGITVAPPAETMTGRTEVANGGTISNSDETVITCETNDMSVKVADGATPYIYIDNAPSWVQGSAPSEATSKSFAITYKYYTHTLTGGAFAGDMRLVKQGDGTLVLPNVTETYTGNTDVWAGSLNFDGTLQNSHLWLNRFAELNSDGGKFMKSIKADYASVIRPGGVEAKASSITTDTLELGFGAKVELDLYSDGLKADQINANVISIEKKTWSNGPAYDAPVFVINAHPSTGEEYLADGNYVLGTVGQIAGSLDNIVVEGLGTNQKATLSLSDGKLTMQIVNYTGEALTWAGSNSTAWDVDKTANFVSDNTGDAANFVPGSYVTFDDNAKNFNVAVTGNVAPSSIAFNNTKTYTFTGDSIIAGGTLTKNGSGAVYLKNVNHIGNTTINGGMIYPSSLANSVGTDWGSLGSVSNTITLQNGGQLATNASITSGQKIIMGEGSGGVYVGTGYTLTQSAAVTNSKGGTFFKAGSGTLAMTGALGANALEVKAGTFNYTGTSYTKQTTLSGSCTIAGNGFLATPVAVASGVSATWTLTNTNYSKYSGALTGSGTITIVPTNTVNRVSLTGNWGAFTGTVKFATAPTSKVGYCLPFNNSYGLANATLDIASGCYVANTGKTFTIGKLTGSGILEHQISDFNSQSTNFSSNTWRVGNSTIGDFTFAGQLYDAGGTSKSNFEKIGTCKMTVSNSWANSGTIKISAGELHLGTGITLGTGALTVADGAILSGIGGLTSSSASKAPMTNSAYTINGTLLMGTTSYSTSGYWDFGGKNIEFGATGVLHIGASSCATASYPGCTTILNAGTFTMKDGATVSLYTSSSFKPTATEELPDSFRVVTSYTTMNIGNVTFDLPAIDGYTWDTSSFNTGYLYLYKDKASGIDAIMAGENVSVDVVAANGTLVANYNSTMADVRKTFARLPLSRGVYVLRVKSYSGSNGTMTLRK